MPTFLPSAPRVMLRRRLRLVDPHADVPVEPERGEAEDVFAFLHLARGLRQHRVGGRQHLLARPGGGRCQLLC